MVYVFSPHVYPMMMVLLLISERSEDAAHRQRVPGKLVSPKDSAFALHKYLAMSTVVAMGGTVQSAVKLSVKSKARKGPAGKFLHSSAFFSLCC